MFENVLVISPAGRSSLEAKNARRRAAALRKHRNKRQAGCCVGSNEDGGSQIMMITLLITTVFSSKTPARCGHASDVWIKLTRQESLAVPEDVAAGAASPSCLAAGAPRLSGYGSESRSQRSVRFRQEKGTSRTGVVNRARGPSYLAAGRTGLRAGLQGGPII
eukprot:1173431-Prorocentrum_minimum.AAC.2